MKKYKNTKQAVMACKKNWTELVDLDPYSTWAGCHLFPAGSNPQLKCYAENIFPLPFNRHTGYDSTLDWELYNKKERNLEGKVKFLNDYYWSYGHYEQFKDQLFNLISLLHAIGEYQKNDELIIAVSKLGIEL